jgi:acetate kinase
VRVLVVNAGSSSLKLRLLGPDDRVAARADLGAPDGLGPDEVRDAVEGLGAFDAVGHRVVHGGTDFRDPVVVDDDVRDRIAALGSLAPLHQPAGVRGIDLVRTLAPDVPAVACFDTAFHATLPPAAATYAIPADWRDRLGVRRYGFHGLSHAYASRRAAELAGLPEAGPRGALRVVSCHLGAGASLAAVAGGRSVDTTMGFTPLEGLVMATRSGSLDPGAVTWLVTEAGLEPHEVADALEHRSGLAALAGTGDTAEVVDRAAAGDPAAGLALDVTVHRLRAAVAAMAAALGGLDLLVFTGGVGEHSSAVRTRTAAGLGFLGVAIDDGRDAAAEPDAEVTADGAAVRTFVVAAREDVEIARGTRAALAGRTGAGAGRPAPC